MNIYGGGGSHRYPIVFAASKIKQHFHEDWHIINSLMVLFVRIQQTIVNSLRKYAVMIVVGKSFSTLSLKAFLRNPSKTKL